MSKKSLITAVSTAAMVATLGFAYAQSNEEGAVPNANINGPIDNSVPKHWARDGVVDANPYDSTAAAPADTTTTMPAPADTTSTVPAPADTTGAAPADMSTSSTTDATSPWAADPAAPAAADAPATTPAVDPVNQTTSSLSTNAAPSETRVDLNSPDDPIYNMGQNNSSSLDERAPRPDRN